MTMIMIDIYLKENYIYEVFYDKYNNEDFYERW